MQNEEKDSGWVALIWPLVLALCLAICYANTIHGLYNIWIADDDYSYAFLIPVISAYLIWERRKDIRSTLIGISWIGGVLFFIFLIISIYGILGSSPSAVRPAMPLIILSIVLFCFGWAIFKKLALPLGMLIFMIPLPTMFGTVVGVRLKLVSTKLGEFILRMFGTSVFVEGNVIDLGVTQLQVVDACSGLRYILPLLAVGVVFAYFFEKSRWKQVLLGAITIPLAIVTNGIRIGVTGILAERYGAEVAEGFFHGFSGWLIFMFAFGLLFVFHFFLKMVLPRNKSEKKSHPSGQEFNQGKTRNNTIPVIITSVSLLLVGALNYTTGALPALKIRGGLSSFPLEMNGWHGKAESIDSEMIEASGAEDAYSAVYRNDKEEIVYLYMGYRASPFGEDENFFHSPNVCMPSSGWRTVSIAKHDIKDVPYFGAITVRRMVSEKMGQRQLVYYWFQTKNRTSYDVNINRFHLALHAIQQDNTHDLFIRPITLIQNQESINAAEIRMDSFVRDYMTVLLEFLDKNQIERK